MRKPGAFVSVRRMVARLGVPVTLALVFWLAFAFAWLVIL